MKAIEYKEIQKKYQVALEKFEKLDEQAEKEVDRIMSEHGFDVLGYDDIPESAWDQLADEFPQALQDEKNNAYMVLKEAKNALLKASVAIIPKGIITFEELQKAPYTHQQKWIANALKLDPFTIPASMLNQ